MKLLLLLLAGVVAARQHYAVLVAGSKSWFNYRHQSDICHAYQILIKGGIPASNIVVMAFDDIAYNTRNPFKGNMINKPNGPNVYQGCKINYKGSQVTASNFLRVLRELPSTSEDHVFIYYSDHGAVGLVAMPSGSPLYATDLISTLKSMHSQNKFKQMVVYIEACESGSMLENLPDNIKIFGTTASSAHESSYAWYYDKTRGVYLGDEYSVKWMENSEAMWSRGETLEQQYKYLVGAVTKSHPHQYGEMDFDSESIKQFQGNSDSNVSFPVSNSTVDADPYPPADSRDVKLMSIKLQLEGENNEEKRRELEAELAAEELHRANADAHFTKIAQHASGQENVAGLLSVYTKPENWSCLKTAYARYEKLCEAWSDYSLKYVRSIVTLCEKYGTARVVYGIQRSCLNL